MPEPLQRRTPAFRVGDIVLSGDSWFLVTSKMGQRCHGRLICTRNGQISPEYPFTSRSVTRAFREIGTRRRERK